MQSNRLLSFQMHLINLDIPMDRLELSNGFVLERMPKDIPTNIFHLQAGYSVPQDIIKTIYNNHRLILRGSIKILTPFNPTFLDELIYGSSAVKNFFRAVNLLDEISQPPFSLCIRSEHGICMQSHLNLGHRQFVLDNQKIDKVEDFIDLYNLSLFFYGT